MNEGMKHIKYVGHDSTFHGRYNTSLQGGYTNLEYTSFWSFSHSTLIKKEEKNEKAEKTC